MYNEILVGVENKIATITINNPENSNPINVTTVEEIIKALEELKDDAAVGAIVFKGAGKNFSAGGNIKRFKTLIETKEYLQEANIEKFAQMSFMIRNYPKPTLAMVNGAAAGAGCSIALACDFRIVTENTKFMMAFIKMGVSGDTGSLYLLQKLVGTAKTMEMMHTGIPVTGVEAINIGLATKLVAEDSHLEETLKFAKTLANSPLHAIKRQKELINEFFYPDFKDYLSKEKVFMAECSRTEDFTEAVYSFLEKRTPQFKGK